LWNAVTGVEALPALRGHGAEVFSVVFNPHGSHIASGARDGSIRMWDSKLGTTALQIHSVMPAYRLSFSSDGKRIISSWDKHNLWVWDATSGHQLYNVDPGIFAENNDVIMASRPVMNKWFVHYPTTRSLSKIPDFIQYRCSAQHKDFLAIGTRLGRVFVIQFPPTALSSFETCTVKGKSRHHTSQSENDYNYALSLLQASTNLEPHTLSHTPL
jgi:WD40 repeat protein